MNGPSFSSRAPQLMMSSFAIPDKICSSAWARMHLDLVVASLAAAGEPTGVRSPKRATSLPKLKTKSADLSLI